MLPTQSGKLRLKSDVWFVLIPQTVLAGFLVFTVTTAWIVIGGLLTEPLEGIFIGLFAAVVTLAVFVLGLPLRLIPRLRAFWFRRAGWSLVFVALALGGVLGSYFFSGAGPVHYNATREWPATDGYDPNPTVFLSSLALLAFTSMHALLPLRRWKALS